MDAADQRGIAPAAGPVAAPLTEAQAGLWYAQRLDPANPIFNTGHYHDIRGPLDVAAFRRAVDTTVAEADALALRIGEEAEGPVQSLDESLRPWLEVIDLTTLPDPEAAARAAMARDMAAAGGERLAAMRLYRLGPQRFFWYQRVHHLAVDAFGAALLARRVARLYAEASRQGPAGVEAGADPPLPGFTLALEEDAAYRASSRRAQDAAYWRDALRGLGEVVSLSPLPPAAQAGASAHFVHRHAMPIGQEVEARLQQLAAEADIPWPDVLAALIGAYCQRHAGAEESVVGIAFMARLGSRAARVPAMLMNVLPLRLRLDETAPFGTVLAEVARQLTRLRRHGRYRGEQIRRDLGRLGGGRRLHGPIINLLPFEERLVLPGLAAELHILGTGPVEDITFNIRGGAAGLRLEIEANPTLYEAADLAGHAARLRHFLGAALAAPSLAVPSLAAPFLAEVPTVTPGEAEWLVHGLNATAHPLPETTLAALIEGRMADSPEAVAVLEPGGRRLSYAALQERSAGLAEALRRRGIGRGDLVAVMLDRSLELMIALVAVLRAGAAYLPLDAGHPPERVARVLASARPALALAPAAAPHLAGHMPLLPPEDWPRFPTRPLPPGPAPQDAAYAIFTSGSTGEPKGAVIGHRAIVNRLEWMRAQYGIGAADRILQKTPATFDVSVWEFFLPLLSGATLVMAPPGAHRDPAAMAALIRSEGITTAHFVPSMLAAFLAEPASRGLSLARVFCSGEELTAALRDRFHATLRADLHNLYGPTEAAVDVSHWNAGPEDRSSPVPIGFPVWNTRLYVLDERLRPVPPGVTGHLFIAGVQLAEGYLGQPALTAQAFIPDPFHPGQRMYRTGDLARLRRDGAIVFLGRSDQQLKLRGLRIEPGEIEAALSASPMVAQARVIARQDGSGEKRLVAYLVPGPAYDPAALRAHVAARVPDYMVPAAFVALDALPVNSSGKLDRAALPQPEFGGTAGRAPQTATEMRLAGLFAEVLGLPRVGAEEDFFELGGHSLLAVTLARRLRESFGRDPGLGAIFENPTVARLAPLMEGTGEADHGLGALIRLRRQHGQDETRPPLFTIHPAGGIAWCYATLARALSPGRDVYGLQAPQLEGAAPPDSLEALAARYVETILPAAGEGPVHLLGWSVGGIIAQAMAARLQALGHRVGLLALLDAYPSDCWRAEPEPDEAAALRALLAIAGHDPEAHPELRDRAAVVAFLRRGGSPLGQLPGSVLDGVVRVVEGNNRLVRAHHHTRYDGPALHVRAALDHAGRDIRPEFWAPYVGRLEVIDIPALHAELPGAAATSRIAPLLAAAMTRREAPAESGARDRRD